MPTIVGILTFISIINTTSEILQPRNSFICQYFSFYEQLKFHAQLSSCVSTKKVLKPQGLDLVKLKFSMFYFAGVYMALLFIITIDLVGVDKLSQAFGLVTMFIGITSMVASPIGGTYAYYVRSWLQPHSYQVRKT